MIELVVMDEMGDRIQYTIRNPLRRLFEGDLSDSKVYTISNFSLSLNDQKYKPTTHSHRIYFKRETQFRIVHEPGFIDHSFHFVFNELILKHSNPQSHLIDVIGLITGKGDTIEFIRKGKSCVYIVVELDDMNVIMVEVLPANQLSQLSDGPLYSLEDNLIKQTSFKNICDLKESSENGTYVTYGTVVAIDYKSGWWYKSCKHCFHALKESENSFHCVTCDTFPNSHVPRFASIEIIGDDNTDSFSTPKRGLIEATSCTKSLIDVYPDFENQSSTKSRKITVEEVHNVVKLHEE
ncbi:hypothetical protein AHAS_Ahas13G0221100 [Arachis hypogaea]